MTLSVAEMLGDATLHRGDARAVLATLPENSIDACVTDPPYGIGFMGKAWDSTKVAFEAATWAEVLRVLKPGGHLLAFGGTRTYHRMTCAIEDAGFEIRDGLGWLYGNGFPKSLNIGDGLGTALKPAWEPIVMARKPLVGTASANVLQHGTGALNIDLCRIEGESTERNGSAEMGYGGGNVSQGYQTGSVLGRWPANILHDGSDEALSVFPESAGQLARAKTDETGKTNSVYGAMNHVRGTSVEPRGDKGSAARFFYCAKASKSERNAGCENRQLISAGEATGGRTEGSAGLKSPRAGAGRTVGNRNFHPTVKPLSLMRYLCRLITPPGGIVLDCFNGSGSTGVAALLENFKYVGIELDEKYIEISRARLDA